MNIDLNFDDTYDLITFSEQLNMFGFLSPTINGKNQLILVHRYIGIDGSNFRRVYLYFRTLQRNYDYLKQHFRLFGLKYYIRVLRGRDKNDQMSIDPEELTHIAFDIPKKPLTNHKSIFNYFVFYLNL